MSTHIDTGSFGANITAIMQGKVLSHFEKNGLWLIIVATDGTAARVGWVNEDTGKQLRGSPFLHNLDTRVAVPSGNLAGVGR